MPDTSPLRPISHWRSGKPVCLCTLVLKTECLRKLDRFAAAGEGKGCLAGGKRSDAADPRPRW